jgi:hypothetical protein
MERMEIDANTALAGMGGLVVGGCAVGGLAYLLLRKSFQSRLDREVAEVKARYNNKLKEQLSGFISLVPDTGRPFVGRPGSGGLVGGSSSDEDDWNTAMDNHDSAVSHRASQLRITDPLEGIDGDYSGGEEADEDPDGSAEADDAAAGGVLESDQAILAVVDRDLRGPYVISLEEFVDPPPGWQQLTIKYFGSDKAMVDERNEPIPHFHKICGPVNGPQDFGGISGDPHIRYVRNQQMESDFEILFDARSYAEGVLNYGQPNKER